MDLGLRKIALVGLRAGRDKEWIVLAPNRQQRRLVLAEILLETRVERDSRPIAQHEVELDIARSSATK